MQIPRIEVVCSGVPRERGLQQGRALREKILGARQSLVRLEAFRLAQPRLAPYRVFRWLAERKARTLLAAALRRDYPAALAQLEGMAAGAGLKPATLMLFNALEPLLAAIGDRAAIPCPAACSAVAVGAERSGIGEPIIARNFDYLPLVQPYYTLRDTQPAGQLRSLDFTIAPLAGAVDGMNERGLCITNNYAFTADLDQPSGSISMAISDALATCTTVAEAAARLMSRPRWGGGLLMLADAAGDVASLELSSTRAELRRPENGTGALAHTNAFFSPAMQEVEVPRDAVFTPRAPLPLRGQRVGESAEARDCRFAELLAQPDPLTPERLLGVMADHGADGQPSELTPCVHGSYWCTTACLFFYPCSRKMQVSYTPACEARFAEFGL